MIHKVNHPALQLIVSSPKAAENDPGSSQGGGNAYEGPSPQPDPEGSQAKKSATPSEAPGENSNEGDAASGEASSKEASDQIALGEVVREFKESHSLPPVRPGLASLYLHESGNAKGLLLNKKVE